MVIDPPSSSTNLMVEKGLRIACRLIARPADEEPAGTEASAMCSRMEIGCMLFNRYCSEPRFAGWSQHCSLAWHVAMRNAPARANDTRRRRSSIPATASSARRRAASRRCREDLRLLRPAQRLRPRRGRFGRLRRRPDLWRGHALHQECRRPSGVLAGAVARLGFRRPGLAHHDAGLQSRRHRRTRSTIASSASPARPM
jgi:hypothetical protein